MPFALYQVGLWPTTGYPSNDNHFLDVDITSSNPSKATNDPNGLCTPSQCRWPAVEEEWTDSRECRRRIYERGFILETSASLNALPNDDAGQSHGGGQGKGCLDGNAAVIRGNTVRCVYLSYAKSCFRLSPLRAVRLHLRPEDLSHHASLNGLSLQRHP